MEKYLIPFLAERELEPNHPAWSKLYAEIERPLQTLNDLFDRFSTLVDPKIARSVIRLSIELDNIEKRRYQQKPAKMPQEGTISVLFVISHGLIESLKLRHYLSSMMYNEGKAYDLKERIKELGELLADMIRFLIEKVRKVNQ